MAGSFQVELEAGDMLAAIDRALAALEQPADLLQSIGFKLESNAQLRFETKTDPDGHKWDDITEATKEIYASDWFIKDNPDFKDGIPGTLLQRTRQLRASLAYNVGPDYLDIGTSRATRRGRWQVGFLLETGTRKMARRGILTGDPKTGRLGAGDERDVLAIVSDYLGAAFG